MWLIEGLSADPPSDRARAEAFAETRGLRVVRDYIVERGAAERARRFWRDRLIADIEDGKIRAVTTPSLSLLADSAGELSSWIDAVFEKGARIVISDEAIDTAEPGGALLPRLAGAMARWSRRQAGVADFDPGLLLERTSPRIRSPAPFGYHWVDGKLEPNPQEAPLRTLVYQLFAATPDRKTVASLLNSRGLRVRSGRRFTEKDVRMIIEDPVSKGQFRGNHKRVVERTLHRDLRTGDKFAYVRVEAVVSEALWDDCNTKLAALLAQERTARLEDGRSEE
ncbi:MAG: recombinase family protein [Brevundimonas aurantiaca]|uniref:recombinase family protein n=1 Tax=Brevundimonas aurantiaca TaxID=74316 RepID=UPI00391A38D9